MSHAKLSPSASDRWMTCPGSIRLSEGMPNSSSAAAEEGTRAHALAEAILKDEYENFTATDEMLEYVRVYTDHVQNLAQYCGGDLYVEQKVSVNAEIYGTADAIIWSEKTKTLYVRDLKYGAGIAVEAIDNTQLKIYALAALLTMGKKAETVDIGIVQPRCPHSDGPIRTLAYEAVDLIDFWADVTYAAEVTKHDDAPLVPGEHCRFCPGAPKCPEIVRQAQENAKAVFTKGEPYDAAELSRLLDWVPTLEAWCKNIREFAYGEAEKGKPIPSYKLVEKRATRKWNQDESTVVNWLLEQTDLCSDDLYDNKLRTPAAIEKLIPKDQRGVMAELTSKESSGHTLVHEDDPREAVRIDAQAAFSNLSME